MNLLATVRAIWLVVLLAVLTLAVTPLITSTNADQAVASNHCPPPTGTGPGLTQLCPPESTSTVNVPGFSRGDLNLAQQLDESKNPPHKWVFAIWRLAISLVNIGVVLFIIFIALATIVRWNVDTYGLKKALPTLVIGVILANFSLLIARGLVDVASILTSTLAGSDTRALAVGLVRALGLTNVTGVTGIIAGGIIALFAAPFGLLILLAGIILVFLPAILVGVLWFLLLVRIGIILVLAAISPLAFAALGFPATQPYFRRWWSMYLNWVFMAPAVFLLLKIASAMGGVANIQNQSTSAALLVYVMAIGVLWFAIQVPFKMGGAIMSAWGGLGKLAAGAGWKSYGSLAAKGKDWQKEGGIKGEVGKFLTSTNLYGARLALQERFETAEARRVKAFKDSPRYQTFAGYEAAYRFRLKDNAEPIRNIDNLEDVQDALNELNEKGQIDKLRTWATDFAAKEGKGRTGQQVLQEFFYRTGPARQARTLAEAGIESDQASRIVLTSQQAQKLLTRRFQPTPIWETLDAALVEKDLPAHGARVRVSRKYGGTGTYGAGSPPPVSGGAPEEGEPPPGWSGPVPWSTVQQHASGFAPMGFTAAQTADVLEQVARQHPTEVIAQRMRAGYDANGNVVNTRLAADFARAVNRLRPQVEQELSHALEEEQNRMHDMVIRIRPHVEAVGDVRDALQNLEGEFARGIPSRVTIDKSVQALMRVRPDLNIQVAKDELRRSPDMLRDQLDRAVKASQILKESANLPPEQLRVAAQLSVQKDYTLTSIRGAIGGTLTGKQKAEAVKILRDIAAQPNHPLHKTLTSQLQALSKATQQLSGLTKKTAAPAPAPGNLLTSLAASIEGRDVRSMRDMVSDQILEQLTSGAPPQPSTPPPIITPPPAQPNPEQNNPQT